MAFPCRDAGREFWFLAKRRRLGYVLKGPVSAHIMWSFNVYSFTRFHLRFFKEKVLYGFSLRQIAPGLPVLPFSSSIQVN